MKNDISSRDDLYALVKAFYTKIREHEVLGPFFNNSITDWDKHFDHLTDFWQSSLFLQTKYYGDPLKAHVKVDKAHNNSINQEHFGLWLNLWHETIDEMFKGDIAQNAKFRARKMSTFLYLKIFEAR